MAKHIHSSNCLPYEKINSLQKRLHDEGCNNIFGLILKQLGNGAFKRSTTPAVINERKSFAEWEKAKDTIGKHLNNPHSEEL